MRMNRQIREALITVGIAAFACGVAVGLLIAQGTMVLPVPQQQIVQPQVKEA